MATVELSDKCFYWEKHDYLFEPEEEGPDMVNNITMTNNSGIINLQSTLTAFTQSVSNADSLNSDAKERLSDCHVFGVHEAHPEAALPDKAEAAKLER